MRTYPRRLGTMPRSTGRFITLASEEFGMHALFSNSLAPGGSLWASANDPVAVPFTLNRSTMIYRFGWVNGSAVGEGIDIGIYDEAWTRLVSIGGVTCAGTASGWEFNDIADTTVPAGRYYLAYVRDNVTGNRVAFYTSTLLSAPLLALCGVQDSATNAYPLPNPLTDMALATVITRMPVMGMAARAA